ncbi:transglutaminase domain-containing protein [Halapricum desulfuricans]|uniref:Transglutaminase-like cysteine protease n=1 Tax=Halapricum desulfuricans TaxID=2841257 RepID=A0A897NAI5_9EURY|nr:transglutaminase domain-containing protein [Halapricum desulfuricans]QSG08365.1 Transglutaminase-like cysteine protease [Halapricum desulfuricans]
MTTDAAPSGREYGRAAFVLGGVLAVVLAGLLLPALVGPLEAAPLESLLSPPQPAGNGAGGQLGALDPGDSTSVGGLEGGGTAALRSQSAETHFVVESTEAAYWRTGAYDTYTGSGWDRSGDTAPYDGSIESGGLVDRTLSYRVELKRAAGALPTVWRPRSVETEAPIEVTDGRAIASSRTVDPGTTYAATSARPPDDSTTLAAAGDDYPDAIEDRYTQLPDSTPDRLGRFTDQVTDGAGSPYETAARIERWLEGNKSYSLNVSDPGGDSVASDFVFDMDEGYCEYFATSMVTMLRTQDIPARYVVGYSTGQPSGENTYTVRGMNAHAWVEVYFPDVGWVQFDPTPGRERMQAEQDALQEQNPDASSYEHTETGSPGERFSPDESGSVAEPTPEDDQDQNGNDGPDTDDGSGNETDPGGNDDGSGDETDDGQDPGRDDSVGSYEVALSDRPVPGTNVTVRVTADGSPAAGVVVLFNGDSIGETDTDGTVIGTVPYERRLNVTVRTVDGRGAPAGDLASDNRLYAGRSVPYSSPRTVRATNRTYEVPTDATLSITGTVVTGRTVTLTATVEGQAIPNATVERDGERVGVTDGDGRLDVALPDRPGSTTLSVRRGAVGGNRTLELHELELTADPRLPVALPWTGVTVTAELGNETVAGLPVSMGGERIGTTGVDGTLSASLPLSDSVSLVTTAYGQRATTTITGLWANLALVFGVLAAVPLGVVVVAYRRGISLGAALDRLVGVVLALPRYLLVALVTAADAAVDVAGRLFRNGRSTLRELWAGNLTRDAIAAAARRRIDAFAGRLRSLRPGADGRSDAGSSTARVSIRAAWAQFLAQVSVTDPETKTPGELAAHAIERDELPADAVETLRDAFRAVEYGARAPEAKLPAVQSAVERLDSTEREDER